MVEPRAARRRRRPGPCGRAACSWCGSQTPNSSHARPSAARRADGDLRWLRTPRGANWGVSSGHEESASSPRAASRKLKTLKVTESTERLKVTPPAQCERMQSVLRLSDLSTDDDDPACCKINKYEKKIDNLMNMVGTLKKEVKMQQMEEQDQMTKRLLEEQKEELSEVTQELVETEHENTRLRRNIERIKEEKDLTVLQKECLQQEKACLMSKLNEAERDGAAAARQINVLKNTIGRLNIEKHMSSTDINALTRQKELLLQKLSTFEETNRTLRELIAEQRCREKDAQKVLDRQAVLLKRLGDLDAENMQLQIRLQGKEKEAENLTLQIVAEKEQAKKAFEFSKSMETMKAHLQCQLRNKEAENEHLTTELRNLELSHAQLKAELELTMEQMSQQKVQGDSDKEALKKAVRAQKERAERSEEYVQKLTAQIAEKDSCISEIRCGLESWRSRCNKAVKEKGELELEVVALNSRVADMMEQLAKIQEKTRDEKEALVGKLQQQTGESSTLKKDNEKLKTALISMEDKLNRAQLELQQLQSSVRNYEELIESYTAQALQARKEADELATKLEECENEKMAIRDELTKELESTRKKFQSQLEELQKLPEILKYTEKQLAECHEQLMSYEKKNSDLCAMIADLRQLVRDWQKVPLPLKTSRSPSS